MGVRNQEKADFIELSLERDPHPSGRTTTATARKYYDGLYYRTDAATRKQQVETWRAGRAGGDAAKQNDVGQAAGKVKAGKAITATKKGRVEKSKKKPEKKRSTVADRSPRKTRAASRKAQAEAAAIEASAAAAVGKEDGDGNAAGSGPGEGEVSPPAESEDADETADQPPAALGGEDNGAEGSGQSNDPALEEGEVPPPAEGDGAAETATQRPVAPKEGGDQAKGSAQSTDPGREDKVSPPAESEGATETTGQPPVASGKDEDKVKVSAQTNQLTKDDDGTAATADEQVPAFGLDKEADADSRTPDGETDPAWSSTPGISAGTEEGSEEVSAPHDEEGPKTRQLDDAATLPEATVSLGQGVAPGEELAANESPDQPAVDLDDKATEDANEAGSDDDTDPDLFGKEDEGSAALEDGNAGESKSSNPPPSGGALAEGADSALLDSGMPADREDSAEGDDKQDSLFVGDDDEQVDREASNGGQEDGDERGSDEQGDQDDLDAGQKHAAPSDETPDVREAAGNSGVTSVNIQPDDVAGVIVDEALAPAEGNSETGQDKTDAGPQFSDDERSDPHVDDEDDSSQAPADHFSEDEGDDARVDDREDTPDGPAEERYSEDEGDDSDPDDLEDSPERPAVQKRTAQAMALPPPTSARDIERPAVKPRSAKAMLLPPPFSLRDVEQSRAPAMVFPPPYSVRDVEDTSRARFPPPISARDIPDSLQARSPPPVSARAAEYDGRRAREDAENDRLALKTWEADGGGVRGDEGGVLLPDLDGADAGTSRKKSAWDIAVKTSNDGGDARKRKFTDDLDERSPAEQEAAWARLDAEEEEEAGRAAVDDDGGEEEEVEVPMVEEGPKLKRPRLRRPGQGLLPRDEGGKGGGVAAEGGKGEEGGGGDGGGGGGAKSFLSSMLEDVKTKPLSKW